jgi:ParB family chromosome partitioning protein
MMNKRRGLGRGLDALLGAARPADEDSGEPRPAPAEGALRNLPVDLIRRGRYQPRLTMDQDSLEDLASSIRSQGVVQPIVVRSVGADTYEIIAGERRWRAAQLAGLHEIPAVIRDVPDEAAIAIALIENIQRENLNPIEESTALQRLIDEFGMTHQQVADAVGRSRAAVSNLLRLLTLEDEVKQLLDRGDLEMGHARALLALAGPAQRGAAQRVVAQGLSVRETQRLVRALLNPQPDRNPAQPDANIKRLEEDLGERLGARVQVLHQPKGKGKLVIQYNTLDELDGILAHIK